MFDFFKKKQLRGIHLIGDSHIGELGSIKCKYKPIEIKVCCVQGATASGLMNPHSKTLAGPIFNTYIKDNVKQNDWVIIHLGEVDCGFLIWVRAEREKIPVNEQLDFALTNYFNLLSQILKKSKHLIVLSVIPPTIKDGTRFGNVANLRGQIHANQIERAILTRKMNNSIQEFCLKNKIEFFNLDEELVDQSTGLVFDKFLHANKDNHHLDSEKLAFIVSNHLDQLFLSKRLR